MNDIVQALLQVGVAPTIAGYLLYDYSKKLTAIEICLVQNYGTGGSPSTLEIIQGSIITLTSTWTDTTTIER